MVGTGTGVAVAVGVGVALGVLVADGVAVIPKERGIASQAVNTKASTSPMKTRVRFIGVLILVNGGGVNGGIEMPPRQEVENAKNFLKSQSAWQ
jgi:hypothetical protein